MIAILALLLIQDPLGPVVLRDSRGRIARSQAAKTAFRHANPCPGGPSGHSIHACEGYVIDHIIPLACGGADAPSNMQWQTKEEAKKKDRWELSGPGCPVGLKKGWHKTKRLFTTGEKP